MADRIENVDYVVCQLCGWEGKQITTSHFKLMHGIKAVDYKKMFPDALITCQRTKDKMKTSQKKYALEHPEEKKAHGEKIKELWKTKKGRERYIEGVRSRRPPTEEQKKKISESMKKVYCDTEFPLRNKNENQYGEDNHFCGRHHTEETKSIIGTKSTKWLVAAYKDGRKTSPFKNLGRGKEKSRYEEAVHEVLSPLGFIYDFPVSFEKGQYLIDFAHSSKMLAIEIDSKLHNKLIERDRRKDEFLESLGWEVIRIKFSSRNENPEQLAQRVLEVIR